MLLLHTDRPKKTLCTLYSLLVSENYPILPSYTDAWASELSTTFNFPDWDKSFILTHKVSTAFSAQETNYKVLTRWYRCPSIPHAIDQTISDHCWRCESDTGTMMHIWWTCPRTSQPWDNLLTLYERLLSTPVQRDPRITLLSMGYDIQMQKRHATSFSNCDSHGDTQALTLNHNPHDNPIKRSQGSDLASIWAIWLEFGCSPDFPTPPPSDRANLRQKGLASKPGRPRLPQSYPSFKTLLPPSYPASSNAL